MNIEADREKWDRIYRDRTGDPPLAAAVLTENAHLLPPEGGRALDLACGLGGNALFLAKRGFEVDALDISETAIRAVERAAHAAMRPVTARVADVTSSELPTERYDVIITARFLERALAPALISALKPGGLLFYQTFVESKLGQSGPSNSNFLLRDNELLQLFEGLLVRYYRDEARSGNLAAGQRDEAFLIAQKPLAT